LSNKRGLGKGLSALIPINENSESEDAVLEISITDIFANKNQPRKAFDEFKIDELAESMKQHGVLQPIILRKKDDKYELVAGERRWRAASRAGIQKIPAIVKEFSDADVMEIALIENLQREDLNPLEEATAYKTLIDEFGLTQDELSKRIGKSRSQIANTVRLLNLEDEIQQYIAQDLITAGHARALLAIHRKEDRIKLAERICDESLSVRQTEDIIKAYSKEVKKKKSPNKKEINPVILHITERLQRTLGTKVKVKGTEKKGKIEIEFYSGDELERILETITR